MRNELVRLFPNITAITKLRDIPILYSKMTKWLKSPKNDHFPFWRLLWRVQFRAAVKLGKQKLHKKVMEKWLQGSIFGLYMQMRKFPGTSLNCFPISYRLRLFCCRELDVTFLEWGKPPLQKNFFLSICFPKLNSNGSEWVEGGIRKSKMQTAAAFEGSLPNLPTSPHWKVYWLFCALCAELLSLPFYRRGAVFAFVGLPLWFNQSAWLGPWRLRGTDCGHHARSRGSWMESQNGAKWSKQSDNRLHINWL